MGEVELGKWLQDQGEPVGGATKGACYMCWIVLEGKPNRLPQVSLDGIKSALQNGGFDEVYLISWEDISNTPEGAKMIDGNSMLSIFEINNLLQAGFHVTHIADYVRCLACRDTQHPAAWFFDMDCIHVGPGWPCQRSRHGFVFGTFSKNPGGRENRKGADQRRIDESLDYCRKPRDQLKLASPFRFPKGNPLLPVVIDWLLQYFASAKPVRPDSEEYDMPFMDKMKEQVVAWGLEAAFAPSDAYCVMPYYAWTKPIEAGSKDNQTWGIDVIKSGRVVSVTNFWQTSRREEATVRQDDVNCVHRTSAWSLLLSHALGPQRSGVELGPLLEWPDDPETIDIPAEVALPGIALWKHSSIRSRFGLRSFVSEGTDGKVYKAVSKDSGELVAVKLVAPDTGEHQLGYTAEPLWLLRSQCSHVVKLIDAFISPTFYAIVMEWVPLTLRHALQQRQQFLNGNRCLELGKSLFGALDFINGQGIVHLDIHSNNVLVAGPEEMSTAKLTDFGRAKRMSKPPVKVTSSWNCFPWRYKAPELVFVNGANWSVPTDPKHPGKVHLNWFRTEVWAAGMVCLENKQSVPRIIDKPEHYGDNLATLFHVSKHERFIPHDWYIPSDLSWKAYLAKPGTGWKKECPWLVDALHLVPTKRADASGVLATINSFSS